MGFRQLSAGALMSGLLDGQESRAAPRPCTSFSSAPRRRRHPSHPKPTRPLGATGEIKSTLSLMLPVEDVILFDDLENKLTSFCSARAEENSPQQLTDTGRPVTPRHHDPPKDAVSPSRHGSVTAGTRHSSACAVQLLFHRHCVSAPKRAPLRGAIQCLCCNGYCKPGPREALRQQPPGLGPARKRNTTARPWAAVTTALPPALPPSDVTRYERRHAEPARQRAAADVHIRSDVTPASARTPARHPGPLGRGAAAAGGWRTVRTWQPAGGGAALPVERRARQPEAGPAAAPGAAGSGGERGCGAPGLLMAAAAVPGARGPGAALSSEGRGLARRATLGATAARRPPGVRPAAVRFWGAWRRGCPLQPSSARREPRAPRAGTRRSPR